MGLIVGRRLSKNASNGDIYGGMYASRLAAHFEIPIKFNVDYDLPTILLDFEAMQRHQFIHFNIEPNDYKYNLIFNMYHSVSITLPAPTLFDHQGKERYYVTSEEADSYLAAVEAARVTRMNEQRARRSFHQTRMRDCQPNSGAGPSHYPHYQWD